MYDQPHFQAEYFDQTTVHPLGLAAMLFLGVLLLALPRRWAVLPVLALACLVPPAQRVVIASLDFNFLRLIVLFGMARVAIRAEHHAFRWTRMDSAVVALTLVMSIMGIRTGGGSDAVIIRYLGELYDTFGMYFMFRFLVRGWRDLDNIVRSAIVLSAIVATLFVIEHFTARNLFGTLGGVPDVTNLRQDRLRCQGAFAHPILAGLFFASLLPLMIARFCDGRRRRWFAALGVASCCVVIVTCSSSTPVVAVAVAVVGMAIFPLRRWMGWIRAGLALTLVVLHLSMQAPVWHLLARVQLVGGSSGWHRYRLIDKWLEHANEWWLMGSGLGTGHWGAQMFDVTNCYVVVSLRGGVLVLALFLLLFVVSFIQVGRMCRAAGGDRGRALLAWALGVVMVQHLLNYMAIAYFGQMNALWYLQLALIGSFSARAARRQTLAPPRPPAQFRAAARRLAATLARMTSASPIRVLYSFPHKLGRAGIGTTAWYQIQSLIAAGHAVSICCGVCERPLPGAVRLTETMRVGGCPVPYRALGVERAWAWHDYQAARMLHRLRDEIDVVHTWPSGALYTLRQARALHIPSLLERPNTHTRYAYEVVAREYERLGLHQRSGHCHSFNAKRLEREESEFRAADRLLCPSDFVAKTFLDRGFAPEQISRHRYGYDPLRFLSRPRPPESRPLTALFAGTCEPRKGLHLALAAWMDSLASKDGTFIICGSFEAQYQRLIEPWLRSPSVQIHGFVSDMPQVMSRADVLVLPALEEGSALVTYEARACGCVLLVSDASGAPVEHGVTGLVHRAGDRAALQEHLTLLATDRSALTRLRENSLRELDALTWSSAMGELVKAYRGCLVDRGDRNGSTPGNGRVR